MTPLFVSRLLGERSAAALHPARATGERCMGNCMDMLSFISFTFAWSRRDHPAAVRYFFPIFDIESKGYISQVGCAGSYSFSMHTCAACMCLQGGGGEKGCGRRQLSFMDSAGSPQLCCFSSFLPLFVSSSLSSFKHQADLSSCQIVHASMYAKRFNDRIAVLMWQLYYLS